MIIVCDIGPLVASVNRRDRHHGISVRLFTTGEDTLLVPATVAVEVDCLLRSRVGDRAARAFLRDVDEGRYLLAPITADVFRRAVELDERHADVGLGLVDASVVAVAEAHRAGAIATLDHAHLRLAASAEVALLPDSSEL
ncbi:MAG: type II toxin-antitoxin system VapC family toxin [Nitriliruptorales bacterium]